MLKRVLIAWIAIAIAVGLTAWLLPGMEVNGGFGSLLIISAVFSIVNLLIGAILRLLTLPINMATLGLFSLVVNAILLMITDWLVDRLDIDNFFVAVVAAIIISVVSALVQALFIRAGQKAKA
jgi:putative membrane protein